MRGRTDMRNRINKLAETVRKIAENDGVSDAGSTHFDQTMDGFVGRAVDDLHYEYVMYKEDIMNKIKDRVRRLMAEQELDGYDSEAMQWLYLNLPKWYEDIKRKFDLK